MLSSLVRPRYSLSLISALSKVSVSCDYSHNNLHCRSSPLPLSVYWSLSPSLYRSFAAPTEKKTSEKKTTEKRKRKDDDDVDFRDNDNSMKDDNSNFDDFDKEDGDEDEDDDEGERKPKVKKSERAALAEKERRRQLAAEKTAAFSQLSVLKEKAIAEKAAASKNTSSSSDQMILDEAIKAEEMMVIGDDGTKYGLLKRDAALSLAKEKDLSLHQVSRIGITPVVCRLLNLGKYYLEKNKKERDARKKERSREIKMLRFRTKTDDNDAAYKIKQGIEFMKGGHPLRIAILFPRPNMEDPTAGDQLKTSIDAAVALFQRMVARHKLDDYGTWDSNIAQSISTKNYIQINPYTEKQREKREKDKEKMAKEAAKAAATGGKK